MVFDVVSAIDGKIKKLRTKPPKPKMVKQNPVANTRQYWSTLLIVEFQVSRCLPTTKFGACLQSPNAAYPVEYVVVFVDLVANQPLTCR